MSFLVYGLIGCVAAVLTLAGFKYFRGPTLETFDAGMTIIISIVFWPITVPVGLCMIVGKYAAQWVNK